MYAGEKEYCVALTGTRCLIAHSPLLASFSSCIHPPSLLHHHLFPICVRCPLLSVLSVLPAPRRTMQTPRRLSCVCRGRRCRCREVPLTDTHFSPLPRELAMYPQVYCPRLVVQTSASCSPDVLRLSSRHRATIHYPGVSFLMNPKSGTEFRSSTTGKERRLRRKRGEKVHRMCVLES